jgi:hypothetical protein
VGKFDVVAEGRDEAGLARADAMDPPVCEAQPTEAALRRVGKGGRCTDRRRRAPRRSLFDAAHFVDAEVRNNVGDNVRDSVGRDGAVHSVIDVRVNV